MLTIVLGPFELMTQKHDNLNVCVGLGKSADYMVYDIDETVINIATQVAASLPFFMPSQELIPLRHVKEKPS